MHDLTIDSVDAPLPSPSTSPSGSELHPIMPVQRADPAVQVSAEPSFGVPSPPGLRLHGTVQIATFSGENTENWNLIILPRPRDHHGERDVA